MPELKAPPPAFKMVPSGQIAIYPVELRRHFFTQVDGKYLSILAVVTTVIFAFLIFLIATRPVVKEEYNQKDIEALQERYARMVLETKIEKKKEPPVSTAAVKAEQKEEAGTGEGGGGGGGTQIAVDRKSETVAEKRQRKQASATQRAAKRAGLQKQLMNTGLFAELTAMGGGGSASSGGRRRAENLLAGASGIDALSIGGGGEGGGGGGFTVATRRAEVQALREARGTKTAAGTIEKSEIGTAAGSQVASQAKVELSAENIETQGEATGEASRTQEALKKVIKLTERRIQRTYENILKKDPNLAGKIVLAISVDANGDVTDIQVVESTLTSKSFEEMLVRLLRQMKFGPAKGGITFNLPFNFTTAE